ncbi:MAG: HDIG domain-containing protein [Clostridium sp.]|uniref:HDIG domain-containing metalloprotein n=1 Tax=Clostridium sp. TaxID=1506 RepID=UPI002A8A3EC7|nr:HDIG domain-containing protein [Clostridium sp.]MDY5099276.1 HDIG domain-containing protein [Clostridium sp.]
MIYRIKQFVWGIISPFKSIDMEYLKENLTNDELEIFLKLKLNEQHHSLRVAKMCEEIVINENQDVDLKKLKKIALLHDVGKVKKHLNLIDKSILVILNKVTHGAIKKYTNIDKVDVYYNHAEYGANILKGMAYDEEFIYVIRNHHKNVSIHNKMLYILKKSDDMS